MYSCEHDLNATETTSGAKAVGKNFLMKIRAYNNNQTMTQ
jgi:hypothetical protein